jgi:GNAT superfamily N-acetyltransferase
VRDTITVEVSATTCRDVLTYEEYRDAQIGGGPSPDARVSALVNAVCAEARAKGYTVTEVSLRLTGVRHLAPGIAAAIDVGQVEPGDSVVIVAVANHELRVVGQ